MRSRVAVFLVFVAAGLLEGCGRANHPPGVEVEGLREYGGESVEEPAFYYRGDPYKPPPPPVVSMLEPAKSAKLKLGEKVHYQVRLRIPENGRLPNMGINVFIRDPRNGATQDSGGPKLVKKTPGVEYLMEGWLKSPRKPGHYIILAEAVDADQFVDRPRTGEEIDLSTLKFKATTTASTPVEFEVVP